MKTEIKENKEVKGKPFPKLMKCKHYNFIVLMSSKKTGVVVSNNAYYEVGFISATWDMSCFEDFNGSITLSNE